MLSSCPSTSPADGSSPSLSSALNPSNTLRCILGIDRSLPQRSAQDCGQLNRGEFTSSNSTATDSHGHTAEQLTPGDAFCPTISQTGWRSGSPPQTPKWM